MPTERLLEVVDLHTHYWTSDGVVRAIDGISFDIGPGEIVGLVGESGSGKTATALSIMRLIPPAAGVVDSGRVLLAGQDLLTLDQSAMRKIRGSRISLVFQNPMTALNPVLTVGSQITEVLLAHQDISAGQARQRAVELLRAVEVPDAEARLRAYPHQLSGGMLQRVMIALAISCDPDVLIADEPTTALDVTIQAQILRLLKRMTRELGMGVLFITHNLGVIAAIADRVAVMYAGKIVEAGPTPIMFAGPRHPYTQALLRSVPRLDTPRAQELRLIPGQPTINAGQLVGCSFQPRCRNAVDRCGCETPTLEGVGDGHTAACWVDIREGSADESAELRASRSQP